jgi:hypothetical protein
MAKRKILPSQNEVLPPSAERRRHGRIVRLQKPIPDHAGGSGRPWRAHDGLDAMAAHGTIDAAQRKAGERFRDDFRRACLDSLHALDARRIPLPLNSAYPRLASGHGSDDAKRRVFKALGAVGGPNSRMGSAAWHILGLEWPIKKWAQSRNSPTWRIDPRIARRVFIDTLDELKKHYRL